MDGFGRVLGCGCEVVSDGLSRMRGSVMVGV